MFQGNTTFNIEEIEIHIRTYRSLLKSANSIRIDKIIDSHINMKSVLHDHAKAAKIDTSAFIYSLLRLPSCMSTVKKIILGQSYNVFIKSGNKMIDKWQEVASPGRRRKMFFNGKDTLAVYIASVTDVDDIITLLTAFQIEWNKFHQQLKGTKDVRRQAAKILDKEDLLKIQNIWGKEYHKFLTAIKHRKVDFTVHLLSGSYMEYSKATQRWWDHAEKLLKDFNLREYPIYFVSSNTHSLVNLLTRFVTDEKKYLIDYLYQSGDKPLIKLWETIEKGAVGATGEYFLYYLSKKALKINSSLERRKSSIEKRLGIHTIEAKHYLDIDIQVIPIKNIVDSPARQLINSDLKPLANSEALIVNIDYPLGWAAYQVLTEIGQNVGQVRGIYILGKAATTNGQIGDILIPNTIFDQHTKNIYAVTNCFKTGDFDNIFKIGSVLDNLKTICAKGTFLENNVLIEKWYNEGYSIIEMESGPYLNAVYEFVYYNRYQENQFVNLTNTPFDLGILHYASDTPYSKAKNLGVRNLSYEGVEPTYASTLAILNRIFKTELETLRK